MTEGKIVPPITSSPARTVVPESKRGEMYAKLELSQEEIDFLENPYREKFLTKFEIGSERLVMYGSPVHMAGKSDLIKTLLTLDPPYTLAKDLLVYGGALTVLWLYVNGYQSNDSVKKLSFAGWLNLNTLVGYFGVSDQVLMDELGIVQLMDRVIGASDQELRDNASVIAVLINRHTTKENIENFRDGMGKMIFRIRNTNEILEKLSSTHVIRFYEIIKTENGEVDRIHYAGIIQATSGIEPKVVAKAISVNQRVDSSGLIYLPDTPSVPYILALYPNLIIYANSQLLNNSTYAEEFARRRINPPASEVSYSGPVV